MAEITDLYVGGYRFDSLEDAKRAETEKKKAAYFELKLRGKSAQNILAVYDNILDEKVFATPVGWEYLKHLQVKLRELGIAEERIRPIPMYLSFSHEDSGEIIVKQRIKSAPKRDKNKERFRISVMVNIILVILVIAMFVIAINSERPNILNYKKAILNEYAAWDQELTEREKLIRQKEAELFTD